MHLNDGQLRAALDHELDARGVEHLVSCPVCRRRADELTAQSQRVGIHLAALNRQSERATSAPVALARLRTERVSISQEVPMIDKILNRRYRAAWAMCAVVALLALSMTLPPVRAWAEGMLAQFRVSKVSVVSVDPTRFNELGVGSTLSKQISQLLSDSVTMTKKPDAPKSAANATDAGTLAGFAVRLPASRSDAP
ncbi:MAG: hypothetical protein KGJ80_21660, partial [Chloroflexota bacterium]|nr:hypothetical protein [Chloroflexota bacterium]